MSRMLLADGSVIGEWWHRESGSERLVCDLCPRACHLKEGDRGFCFVRENRGGELVLSTYGKSTGFCIDPIEKKPLNHFFPGTSVLSFGTAGCNLGCKFCQNWDISKSREVERLSHRAMPEAIAQAASELGCRSVAFTYNDPVVWAEYAIDTAKACRDRGIRSVAVTAGYMLPQARKAFYQWMDAANVDLKGFTEDFYWKTTSSHLAPVLETLKYLKEETEVWFEITNLMIPAANDSRDEVTRMCEWLAANIGTDVPLHFTAFHPDFRMLDRPRTPMETLVMARDIAQECGLQFVYVGNVHDVARQSTYCPSCGMRLIERDWYVLGEYRICQGSCPGCGATIPGRFEDQPGEWGNRRQPVDMSRWSDRKESQETAKGMMSAETVSVRKNSCLLGDDLTPSLRQGLLRVASRAIARLAHDKPFDRREGSDEEGLVELMKQPIFGLFTTLKRGKLLRGCCGSIGSLRPLGELLHQACVRTTLDDQRMPAISPSELPYLQLDISLLDQLEPISARGLDRLRAFEIGKHGLHIQRNGHTGLLLPSVSVEQGWDALAFLEGVCRKAGLQENDWQKDDCQLQRFAGCSVSGPIIPSEYQGLSLRRAPIVHRDQIILLQRSLAANLTALGRGATPMYYVPNAPDGTVNGLVVSFYEGASKQPLIHLIRLSMRPGMPLQSTLFELAQTAFQALQKLPSSGNLELEIALTILHDPSAHGAVAIDVRERDTRIIEEQIRASVGLEGLSGSGRALVGIVGNDQIVVSLHPTEPPEAQIIEMRRILRARRQPISVFSLDAVSTRPFLIASNVAQPVAGNSTREAAVAGRFFPAEDEPRRALVKKIFEEFPPSPLATDGTGAANAPSSLVAIMVPHAGLVYSGKVAASVWRKVSFPKRLLMIGPKHTPHGVAWAVAPHARWKLSDSVAFSCDVALARTIAEQVDGMELDEAAHRSEHGVEVQLPFLEYLNPSATFAAIAMQGSSWPSIQTAAKQLSEVLSNESDLPLLVISSDMNHYAEDAENRRRDRLALDAMAAKDPKGLINVCREHQISMCGLVPAALVMQTLAEMRIDYQVRETMYATSGEIVKSDRVVGYAGVTFERISASAPRLGCAE